MNVKSVRGENCPKSHIHNEHNIFEDSDIQNTYTKEHHPTSSPGPLGTDEPWCGGRAVIFIPLLTCLALASCKGEATRPVNQVTVASEQAPSLEPADSAIFGSMILTGRYYAIQKAIAEQEQAPAANAKARQKGGIAQ